MKAGQRVLETADFPFEVLSDIAELESWRKEIHRPPYHIHKWWAQRLGSVFRAVVLGAFAPRGTDLEKLFYAPVRLGDVVVFDPFMGSGTTIGETLKLGGRAIGRDINPVAYRLVKNAMDLPPRQELRDAFHEIERDVRARLWSYYLTHLPDGTPADVLYYFWVKQVDCPSCTQPVDLFSSYVFARHSYPKRHPEAQVLCPGCGEVNQARYDAARVICASCETVFDPSVGPADGVTATCSSCTHRFPIAKTVRGRGRPPAHRLYAKLVLTAGGEKIYLRATDEDRALYERAEGELTGRPNAFPRVRILPGHNTAQVLGYAYSYWHEMFNARQLLCLSLLAERIRALPDERLRDVFCCLFSGVLEFNNTFASFKGEGTGAVRHMFSHHILKPERTPLEANIWGTPRSSGAFSTLFERRILKALDYCENPFELRHAAGTGPGTGERGTGEKVLGLSEPLFHVPAPSFRTFREGQRLYLSCGDSARTDIETGSVDAVVTDPPFFDNVHYSELADFFFVWQEHILGAVEPGEDATTRSPHEVQAREPEVFSERLGGVFRECHRVLKSEGLLVFSYHHSRAEGWRCVFESILRAGFGIVRAHPIKAEMSGATPKRQAHEPIDLDIILVCRKRPAPGPRQVEAEGPLEQAAAEAASQLGRLQRAGRAVSRNDIRIVLTSQLLVALCRDASIDEALARFDVLAPQAEAEIERLHRSPEAKGAPIVALR
jgi:putative DNA methylase